MTQVLIAVAAAAALAAPAAAADPVQGGDTLPYLFDRAELVVAAEKAEPHPDTARPAAPNAPQPRASAYRVTVREAVKGTAERGAVLNVCLPRSADVKSADAFASSFVFLRPLREQDRAYWWG